MIPLTPLCAFALLAAAPEGGTISITTTSAEAAADYVEAYDQLFAGHADIARAAANHALALDPNLALAQALLYAITPGTDSMTKVDAAAAARASRCPRRSGPSSKRGRPPSTPTTRKRARCS
jgi:hypothetical protein